MINSTKNTARLAGFLYLLLAITAAFGIMYVSSQTFVKGDAIATANNILSNEFLFRAGILGHLTSQVLFIFLVMLLYRLFKQVDEHQAKLMVALVLVQIPIVFLVETFNLTALMLLKGEILASIELKQAQEWSMIFLRMHDYGIWLLQFFYGLWLFPFGYLSFKSGFIPKIFGIMLLFAGVSYMIDSSLVLLFPEFRNAFSPINTIITAVAEVAMVFWLLIKGVNTTNE